VSIEVGQEDRRSRRLRLTDRGREVLASAVPIWRETHRAIEAGLPGLDADGLRAALVALS
jgi:DNA-binding MarR family transcriptional regulator